ncbi:MAG: recombinase family protein [Candidatus Sericytochromatia bacterium]|nr:recombinase family protein [Candidatus Tanganyikabacteria bacterium]
MKAIGYIRVSTQEQAAEGISLAAQEAKIRAYADLYGLDLVDVVTDAGVSAKSLDRPGLADALARLEAGEADGLVILKLDRLTRSVSDWEALIDRHFGERAGKALMSVSDQIDTRSAGGRLVLRVLVTVSMWEREAVAERTALALAHKQAQGEHVGSVPFGYRIEGGRLVAADAEAVTVDRIVALRSAGLTLRGIADTLAAEGIATKRGGAWAPAQVANILRRAGR